MINMNYMLATTSITTPEYDIPPMVYSFGDYEYIVYENNIIADELVYEGIEYISRLGFKFPKITEKIRIVLSNFQSGYTVFTPNEQWMKDVADLRKEISQTTRLILKEIHTLNKSIKMNEKQKEEYWRRYENIEDANGRAMYHMILEEQYQEQDEYLRLNLETGICLGFVDDLVEHVSICDATKLALIENTPLSEATIIYDIIQFL